MLVTNSDEDALAKCLDICQTLANQDREFHLKIKVGKNFNFSLNSRKVKGKNQAKPRRMTPSAMRRRERRRAIRQSVAEEAADKSQAPVSVSVAERAADKSIEATAEIVAAKAAEKATEEECIIEQLDGANTSINEEMSIDDDKEEEEDEDKSWKVVRSRRTSSKKAEEEEKENTVAVAVTADATDTAAVTELSNNYLRELWEWADNFRIDSARWERADTKGEMVPIPPALTVRNWKKLMRTIKGSEDAEENRKVGEDGWINPIHPIQCKNDYLDIFYNWMANFDLGKCYWMVNDAADKAIPRPPAVHESILWRMKNHDRKFTISGPPPGAWKFKKDQARMRFGKKSEIKRKSWRSKAN